MRSGWQWWLPPTGPAQLLRAGRWSGVLLLSLVEAGETRQAEPGRLEQLGWRHLADCGPGRTRAELLRDGPPSSVVVERLAESRRRADALRRLVLAVAPEVGRMSSDEIDALAERLRLERLG